MLLINSPPIYQPFESPQRLGHSPLSSMSRSPRVISCEELERDCHPPSPQEDKTDGFLMEANGGTIPLSASEKVPNVLSVLDALRMMSVNEGNSPEQSVNQDKNSALKKANGYDGHVSTDTNAEFQQPPKVQNIATVSV